MDNSMTDDLGLAGTRYVRDNSSVPILLLYWSLANPLQSIMILIFFVPYVLLQPPMTDCRNTEGWP